MVFILIFAISDPALAQGQTLLSIDVTPANPTITVGQTQQFTATGTFSDGSTQLPPPSGLVSWWNGDAVSGTTAFDIRDGNDGTMAGGVNIVPGLVGNSFSFDGVDDFMNVGQPLSVREGTVDFWVNRQGLTAEFGFLSDVFIGSVDLAALPNRAPTLFVRSSGTLLWEFGNLVVQDTRKPLPVGEWHHLAMTWKQNPDSSHSVVVYLDGMNVASGTAVGVTGFTDLLVGVYNFPNLVDQFAKAIIDELEVYNRALSPTEIQSIFNAGTLGKCKFQSNCVTWSSSNTLTATIDANGLASGLAAGATTITATSSGTSKPSGLVNWWPGDGNANDVIGVNNGTLMNGTTFAPGLVGQAFSLDGVDDFVEIADNANLKPTSAITVDAWVKVNSIPDGVAVHIIDRHTSEEGKPFEGYILGSNGPAVFSVFTNPSNPIQIIATGTTNIVGDGKFHHVAGTYDGSVVKVYVDGVLEGSAPGSGSIVYAGALNLLLGANQQPSIFTRRHQGLIDEVGIYNRALTATEIQAIFTGSISTGGISGSTTLTVAATDSTPPVIVPTVTPATNAAGWNNTNVTVSWSVTDPESGIASSSGCTSTSLITETSGAVLTCIATNGAGLSNSAFVTVKIDKTSPPISAASSPLPNGAGWNNTNVTVSFTCTDSLSGIASCSGPVTVTAEGTGQVIAGSARDLAGNSATASKTVKIDKTPPITSATPSGTLGVSCYSSDVGVSLTANDNLSGVSSTLYSLDGGIWQAYAGILTVTTEGVHLVKFKSTDKAQNNEAEKSISFTIDKTPPEAILKFDPTTKDIKVYNSETGEEAAYVVLPSNGNEDDNDEEDQDEEAWELRQYTLKDCANNPLILVLKHKMEGNEAKVKVISMQYNGAQVIDAAKNKQEAEYAEDKIGSIKELEQKIKVKKQFEVKAKFQSRKNESEIKVKLEGQKEDKETKSGMVILRLSTNKGGLTYSY